MFHVFLDNLYSNSPTSSSIAYPRKMRFPCLCFFYKSCERKTIPLILSPESQVTLTILSTLRPLYHNPHSHSLQFTKIYHFHINAFIHFSYTYIYIFFVLSFTIHTSPSQFSQLQNWSDRERKMLDVFGIKNFSYFLWLIFSIGVKNGKLVAGVMLTKRLCLSSSHPPHIVKIENCKLVYWIPRPK